MGTNPGRFWKRGGQGRCRTLSWPRGRGGRWRSCLASSFREARSPDTSGSVVRPAASGSISHGRAASWIPIGLCPMSQPSLPGRPARCRSSGGPVHACRVSKPRTDSGQNVPCGHDACLNQCRCGRAPRSCRDVPAFRGAGIFQAQAAPRLTRAALASVLCGRGKRALGAFLRRPPP